MANTRWIRPADDVLTVTDLASMVMKGFYLHQDNMDMGKTRGLTVQMPVKVHDRLDAIVAQIPGMNKGKFVSFIIDAGIYEFCKAIIDNTPTHEPRLFDEEDTTDKHEQEVFEEAMSLLGGK